MEGEHHERRVPKWLARSIGLLAIIAVVLFVSFAFRSSKPETDPEAAEAESPGVAEVVNTASGDFISCTDCHENLDRSLTNGSAADRLLKYTHKMHFSKGVSDCANCHPLPAHEADETNAPTMGRCYVCHGTSESSIAPGTCETCHPANSPAVPTSHRIGNWLKDHPESALEDPFQCATCHAENFCQSCHGLKEMPHPDDWVPQVHVQTFFDTGFNVCQNCHIVPATPQQAMSLKKQDFCDSCHHEWGPKNRPWIKVHPEVVKDGEAQACFECHNPSTCATCHVTGVQDLSADQANFAMTSSGGSAPNPAEQSPASSPSEP